MPLDIDAIFGEVADTLINQTFSTPITYIRLLGTSYDPSTGDVVERIEQYQINAGIEQIGTKEEGGVGEVREIKLFIEHGPDGVPHASRTGDRIEYRGEVWKVTSIDPEFTSKSGIASYITARVS